MTAYPDELNDATDCIDCGAAIWADVSRGFACGTNCYLCFECAERRGGVYDSEEDRWTRPPDMSGLPDERRPHL